MTVTLESRRTAQVHRQVTFSTGSPLLELVIRFAKTALRIPRIGMEKWGTEWKAGRVAGKQTGDRSSPTKQSSVQFLYSRRQHSSNTMNNNIL